MEGALSEPHMDGVPPGSQLIRRSGAAYAPRVTAADSERARIQLTASWILETFDEVYAQFLRLTWAAKAAFECRDHPAAIANARRRLGLYNDTVYPLAEELERAFPQLKEPGRP